MVGKKQGYDAIIEAPFGRLGIRTDANAVSAIDLVPDSTDLRSPRNALAREAKRQLTAYFRDSSYRFDLPLHGAATPFQDRVRSALRRLRPGHAVTYGQLASTLETSPRRTVFLNSRPVSTARPIPIM